MEFRPLTLVHFLLPLGLAVLTVLVVRDPTYRFPILALLLPFFLRGAATASGIQTVRPSATVQTFTTIGFAAFVIGWLLTLGVVGFVVAIGVFSAEPSADLLKRIMLFATAGLVLAAWFLWPWYARLVLPDWPHQDVRIWTSSGNRWDRVFTAWRLRQMAASGVIHGAGVVSVPRRWSCSASWGRPQPVSTTASVRARWNSPASFCCRFCMC